MKTKKILFFISTALIIGAICTVVRAENWGLTSFSWIGNNTQEGIEQGYPVIGMVGLKGSNYQVVVSGDGDQRPLVGSAWLGIGSLDDTLNDFTNQSDAPSLGWIHFNQSFDSAKLATLIGRNCFGAGDCWGARWNKKPNSTNKFEGYLSGWARVEMGPNGDTTAYPDIWLHFKAPTDVNNYACDGTTRSYYVCSDVSGLLDGFAWSSGTDATTVAGNPGLGWIRFTKQYSNIDTSGVIAANNGFCAALPGDDSADVACKSAADFTGQFNFKAYQSGITLNKFNSSKNYQWLCAPGAAPQEGEKVTCTYDKEGTYSPQLKVYNEATQKWVDCTNQASVKVTSEAACGILVREAQSGSKTEFGKELTINPNSAVEAKVNRQCIGGGEVKWSVTGGSSLLDSGDTAEFKPIGGTFNISAQIIQNGKTIKCTPVTIGVNDSVKWR
jgi:hypothetical protein